DDITLAHQGRRDVGFATVKGNVAMVDDLPGLRPGVPETEPISNVIQAGFKDNQQVDTRDPGTPLSLGKMLRKLSFQYSINRAQLLFFPQLQSILGRLPSRLGVRARRGLSPLDGAFRT